MYNLSKERLIRPSGSTIKINVEGIIILYNY